MSTEHKKIRYITTARIPTQRAHGLQIMKMCEAFARRGAEVELVIPRRPNEINEDPFDYYRVKKTFQIRRLWTLSFASAQEPRRRIFYLIETATFAWSVFWYAALRARGMLYFRFDRILCLALYPFLRKRSTTCEAHFFIEGWWQRLLLRCENIVVVNKEAKRCYDRLTDLEEKILVAPDGVSLEDYEIAQSKEELRKELDLPRDKKIALYTGYFYRWKGIETIVRSAEYVKSDVVIVLVGGAREDSRPIQNLIKEKKLANVMVIGHQPYRLMPKYQKAADCLLVSGTMLSEKSARFTSPLKLFEYMASCVPIVAPRTPALEEILRHRENAYIVVPDNPEALAEGIQNVFSQKELADIIVRQARLDVAAYQWESRAKNILDFIHQRAVALRVLYLFAGARRWMIEAWRNGVMADSQMIGLNHLWKYGVRARYYETPFMNELRKIQFHLAQFAALGEMRRHDVIFLGSNLLFVFFVKYILRWNKPKLVFYNTFLTNTLKRNKKGIRARIIGRAIRSCDIIICPSTAQKRYLESRGFDASKIVFVPNGVDADFFQPRQSPKSIIVAVGKDLGRDYRTLIEAARDIKTPLVVIAAERNMRTITQIPAHVSVCYDVAQKETAEFYRRAIIAVVPTFAENRLDASDCSGQYAMLEAMAAGKALVMTKRSTLDDYVRHGKNALLVEPGNAKALKDAIQYLLKHPNIAAAMGEANRKAVEEHFTSSHVSGSLQQVFLRFHNDLSRCFPK